VENNNKRRRKKVKEKKLVFSAIFDIEKLEKNKFIYFENIMYILYI